ncbi:MAG: hydantoinase B/oxoprolinase family protein [Gammaproteobacteria bacterium]|nr:hydantoinase B/oxoprolinase family protein [Gammaproteobacteria bacterium]
MSAEAHDAAGGARLSEHERRLLDEFLAENRLFYGPDPEIMRHHALSPRTAAEERALGAGLAPSRINLVRERISAALNEVFSMVEQTGVAPGAKWGDLVSAIFTEAGDLSQIGPQGIAGFAAVCHYPIRFIRKYWMNDPSVGVREGDAFIHNDSRYGNIHNTDQSMIMPLFHDGEIVCWLAATIHEGECGAIEPGGMPSIAESKYDEGLKMCPFKCAENFRLKRDLVNFLQNSVRDPKLQLFDMKVKLHAVIRMRERMLAIIGEFGHDCVVATLRTTLEDTEAEVKRRIAELPDGTVRLNTFIDGDLREHILAKFPLEITVKGNRMTFDFRGACPELTNRSVNTAVASLKSALSSCMLLYVWPDLPVNQAAFSPIEVVTNRNSLVDPSDEAPNAMSLIPLFRALSTPSQVMAKFNYCLPRRYTAINASHYNQPATFVYGGLTQHIEITGNFCADINGCGAGGREDNDGEHAMSPSFGAFADTGEFELAEEELPFVRLVAQQLTKDRVGFGKQRGGMGYEQVVAVKGSDMFGFMTGQCGALHPSAYGLFGGYACPAYPLAKIKDVNVFDVLATHPERVKFSMIDLMNEQAIPGARYVMQDAGLPFELAGQGEVYMICQGSGGGYGDVLERDPGLVMQDVEEGLLSPRLAREIYFVAFDEQTLVADNAATSAARAVEREARKQRGVPFDAFCAAWVKPGPDPALPYLGAWGPNDGPIIATPPGGPRSVMPPDDVKGIFVSNPKDRRIAELEARVAALEKEMASRRA